MSSLPSAIMNSGGGTKKPFSYCPGGIDFSELKSPKIARRIAKHQAGMNEPSSTLPTPQKVKLLGLMMIALMSHVRLCRHFHPPPCHLKYQKMCPAPRHYRMWSRWWEDRGVLVTFWPLMWKPQHLPHPQLRQWARPRPITLTLGTDPSPFLRPPHPQSGSSGRVRRPAARSQLTELSPCHPAPPPPLLPRLSQGPGTDQVFRLPTPYTSFSWPTSNTR